MARAYRAAFVGEPKGPPGRSAALEEGDVGDVGEVERVLLRDFARPGS
jgi:hypothetical protein